MAGRRTGGGRRIRPSPRRPSGATTRLLATAVGYRRALRPTLAAITADLRRLAPGPASYARAGSTHDDSSQHADRGHESALRSTRALFERDDAEIGYEAGDPSILGSAHVGCVHAVSPSGTDDVHVRRPLLVRRLC